MNNPYQQYRDTQVKTANQGKLILMLYDGAIRFLREAEENIPLKKYDIVNQRIVRTQDILTELMVSLNMSAGELSGNLYRIYEYLNRRLIEANIKKDVTILREVLQHLGDLREVWDEVIRSSGEQASMTQTGSRPGGLNVQG